jgi:hypothetical protein
MTAAAKPRFVGPRAGRLVAGALGDRGPRSSPVGAPVGGEVGVDDTSDGGSPDSKISA